MSLVGLFQTDNTTLLKFTFLRTTEVKYFFHVLFAIGGSAFVTTCLYSLPSFLNFPFLCYRLMILTVRIFCYNFFFWFLGGFSLEFNFFILCLFAIKLNGLSFIPSEVLCLEDPSPSKNYFLNQLCNFYI